MELSSNHSSIAMIIFSWSMGFLTYYILSDFSKEKRKASMEEVLGQLINFTIFIWIGKIILNLRIFIEDPLAILSYPSNSNAFYLAILLSVITIVIQYNRGKVDALLFSVAFTNIFLTASFVYEFMQVIWNKNTYSIGYMGLVAFLNIAFVVIRKFVCPCRLNLLIFLGWTIGSFSLAVIQPILMIFGYTVGPWFLVLILIICCFLMVYQKMKEGVINGRN
ncbi:hypothetical protein KHA96_22115 [Bacillus sp. FJAT-49711]|uniref:hypothetical protein n=1 Tax=Bacillus sp. FJAT-49711 TaxID=2833585 RepID=UPI001BCA3550|nr:hypothetical protein [Bacillus sp. FJAT-49711]MBS4220993.1 hypothetical protein [Bacillus sp. FJAT-49711]